MPDRQTRKKGIKTDQNSFSITVSNRPWYLKYGC